MCRCCVQIERIEKGAGESREWLLRRIEERGSRAKAGGEEIGRVERGFGGSGELGIEGEALFEVGEGEVAAAED